MPRRAKIAFTLTHRGGYVSYSQPSVAWPLPPFCIDLENVNLHINIVSKCRNNKYLGERLSVKQAGISWRDTKGPKPLLRGLASSLGISVLAEPQNLGPVSEPHLPSKMFRNLSKGGSTVDS